MGSNLNFCSEIWGYHKAPDIEKLHLKFIRPILGVKRSTNTVALYGETGRFPLEIIRTINMLKYWLKVLSKKVETFVLRTF